MVNKLTSEATRMPLPEALAVLAGLRQDGDLLVGCMGGSREWLKLPPHVLDFHHVPSAMGATAPLALGLALAQPNREVLLLIGDGSLLMNLGALVTIAASGAKNLAAIVVDNGVYEVTGGQKTPARTTNVDFATIARGAGIKSVFQFAELDDWRQRAAAVLAAPGPRCIWLIVEPITSGDVVLRPPCPITEQIARLRAALSD